MKPIALASLERRKFGARVRVRARVTHVRGHEAHLVDTTGHVLLVCEGEPPAEGALLDLSAEWAAPGRLVAARIAVVQVPTGEFRYAASELAAMQGKRRERLARRAESAA